LLNTRYTGSYEQALVEFTKVFDMRKQNYGTIPHPDLAESYNTLGITNMKLGDKIKGVEYSEKSLNEMLAIFGKNHAKVST
jgi:hypothetical protein